MNAQQPSRACASGTGPSGPHLTPSEWAHVEALCTVNANAANSPIRVKIATYFQARTLAATRDDQVSENPARFMGALVS